MRNEGDTSEGRAHAAADEAAVTAARAVTPSTLWLMEEDPDPDPAPEAGVDPGASLYEDGEVRAALMDMDHALGAESADLGGPADPNNAGAQETKSSTVSLILCALADTLSRSRA